MYFSSFWCFCVYALSVFQGQLALAAVASLITALWLECKMAFSRIESVVFYTCTILFGLMVFFIFYRAFVFAWRKLCQRFQRNEQRTSQEQRAMELLQRPQIRDILATRMAANVSQKPQVDALPPPYDSLSIHSGPPPSYHSNDIDLDR